MQYQGVVFANIADLYYVLRNNGQLYACKLRNKLKTRILSGDLVDFMILDDTWGIIEKLLPRSSELYCTRESARTQKSHAGHFF